MGVGRVKRCHARRLILMGGEADWRGGGLASGWKESEDSTE